MRTVYKYPARMTGPRNQPCVKIPNCLKVVLFGPQSADGLFVWAEVESVRTVHSSTRSLLILGTGDDIPDGCEHVASCQDGPYVWHLYERTDR